jgi:hypothetical protein
VLELDVGAADRGAAGATADGDDDAAGSMSTGADATLETDAGTDSLAAGCGAGPASDGRAILW